MELPLDARKNPVFGAVNVVLIVLVICTLCAPLCCTELQLTLKVSRLNGSDVPSCLVRNAAQPCKSLEYALASLPNLTESRGIYIYNIITLDRTFVLEKQLEIIQPDEKVSLSIESREGKDTILHCASSEAGVTIGSQFVPVPVIFARNIHFKRLRFQNCGPKYGASVLVWNSHNISFSLCSFRDNSNAGLNVFDSSLSIDQCAFVNNTSNVKTRQVIFQPGIASAGGGLGVLFIHAINRSITVTRSDFFSNTALFNNTEYYIAPSSNMSSFYNTGGGTLVAFLHNSKHNSFLLENCTFVNNSATYGGGVLCSCSEIAADNSVVITGGILRKNRGAQSGGAIGVSQWDRSRRSATVVRNSTITHNWARRGGGVHAFFMNNMEKADSALKFDRVHFDSNTGRVSTAIMLTSALPLGYPIACVPEFINCTITDHRHHDKTPTSVSSPFTSFRVDTRFRGHNIFARNRGSGAIHVQNSIIHVEGKLELSNNTGYKGAGMWLSLSQIKLYPRSELLFVGNMAASIGGALCADTFSAHGMIHEYNTDCFLTYVHPKGYTPPASKWKTKVSFIRNSAGLNGAAVFATTLESCLWTENYPYHSYTEALRWNNKFEYKMNYLLVNNKEITGWKYDIATSTVNFRVGGNYSMPFMLSPGENITLDIKGVDQLNNTVHTVASLNEPSSNHFVGDWILENKVQVFDPFYNRNLPFMYRVESISKYDDLMKSPITHKIAVTDIYSSESNRFVFEVTSVPCRPGFLFVDQECRCNKAKPGVLRCKGAREVYLEEGYWGGVENGELVTYFCPYKYCNCITNGDLPGCMFDSSNPDSQCNPGREGHLCGRCKGDLSVGLRPYECLDCQAAGWFLVVVVAAVVLFCIFIIWLNMGISNDLRGPLFVFQMLPFVFEPRNSVGDVVSAVTDTLHFGGPFVFVFKTCAVDGMNNLYDVALGYVMPFATLGLFVISYILSANYLIRLKFRHNSPLQSFWLIILFMYTYLVETSFLLHHCPKVGNQHVFFYDGNIKCYHGNHLIMVILASFVLVLFVIPPPVIVVMLTTGIWKVDSQYVSTLTSGLNRGRLWWWAIDLGRRVLIVATFVFVPDWLTRQVLMVLVCIIILALHSNFQPYKIQRINTTETVYLIVLATLATLQLLNEKDIQTSISAVILALIVLHTVMLSIYKGFRFFRKRFCTHGRLITNKSIIKYGAVDTLGYEVDPEVKIKSAIFDAIFGNANDNSLFDKGTTEKIGS